MVAKNRAVLLFQGATEPLMIGSVATLLANEIGTFRVTVSRGIRAREREVRVQSGENSWRTFLVPAS